MTSPIYLYLDSPHWQDYRLLDSGHGQKLEQFGPYHLIRPKSQAVWSPALPKHEWEAAHATFQLGQRADEGQWDFRKPLPERWPMRYGELSFWAKATPYRHLGVFPEQAAQWDWMSDLIQQAQRPIRILNLFGYTGLASLSAAQAGAEVTHVDASKPTIAWARENQTLAGLAEKPIRWIVEDALKYSEREVKRGSHYDGIIMDPPPFGRGPNGEVWKFDKSMPRLLEACRALLSPAPLFAVITTYTTDSTLNSLMMDIAAFMSPHKGHLSAGTAITIEQSAGRMLEMATFARWQASE
jgi:23S rRNA (cytosine1962-C5)-methyltransferase